MRSEGRKDERKMKRKRGQAESGLRLGLLAELRAGAERRNRRRIISPSLAKATDSGRELPERALRALAGAFVFPERYR